MTRLTLVLSSSLLSLVTASAQDGDSIPLHDLLVAAKLPQGYQTTTQELKAGEKILGQMIVVSKAGQISKVIVRIESRDRSTATARRAASGRIRPLWTAGRERVRAAASSSWKYVLRSCANCCSNVAGHAYRGST